MWWVRNRGRCLQCGGPASRRYPLLELVTAGVFAGASYLVGTAWSLPAYLWFVSVTVVLGFIDAGHRLIPNRILVPGTVVGFLLLAGAATLEGRLGDIPGALAAGIGYFATLLVPALLTRGAIGMGDVKLAFLRLREIVGFGFAGRCWRLCIGRGCGGSAARVPSADT